MPTLDRSHIGTTGDDVLFRTTRQLRFRVRELETELSRTRERMRQAEERAALAQRSASDAWTFVKLMRTPVRQSSQSIADAR